MVEYTAHMVVNKIVPSVIEVRANENNSSIIRNLDKRKGEIKPEFCLSVRIAL